MKNNNATNPDMPAKNVFNNQLDEVLRQGAQKLLTQVVQMEVESFLESKQYLIDDQARRLVTGNGYHKPRFIATGAGAVEIKLPRVRDQILPSQERFKSSLIPPYLRRTKNMDEFIPYLYLKSPPETSLMF